MHVRWLGKARLNLDSIHDYIAHDNRQAASRVIQQTFARVDDLAVYPNLETVVPFRIKGGVPQVVGVIHTCQC